MAGRPPGDSADGRLRLLDACWALLLENEPGERLTIAAVCDRAKCTPPTLYHHFGDLANLELAASARAFGQWAQDIKAEISKVKDPRERLHRHGRAYLEWAYEHPDAYMVLFARAGKLGPDGHGPKFPDLLETLAAIHDRDQDDPGLFAMGFAFWSAVHGLACLGIASPLPEETLVSTLEYFEASLIEFGPPEAQDWASDMIAKQKAAAEAEEPRQRRSRPRF
ncbi:TetR/AcrR family transcriptional regulator [Tessaracoccus rhinocerotis]|uniref:TetR/AcrR family transcriptional regulator n=1 Tax=Tessaracoccus rhinocerotis TaxID=1689449 RepID=A0A553K634_9ACTN|nr:TetR/AcrR family transcriptional regulator [Tessaracoccus rhinocerotis]TRY20167.1 TetR/AcrR family transcriptional regulator [Tessaracoccus rhinocerotis]